MAGLDPRSLAGLRRLPERLEEAQRRSVGAAALAAKRSIQRQPGYATRLRNVGRSGARINVRFYDLPRAKTPTVIVQAVGPMHLIERDTKPHQILPRGVGRAKGRTKAARREAKQDLYDALFGNRVGTGVKPLRTPYGPRFRVNHPGTKGRHPFERGVERAMPEMRRIMRSTVAAAVTQSRF